MFFFKDMLCGLWPVRPAFSARLGSNAMTKASFLVHRISLQRAFYKDIKSLIYLIWLCAQVKYQLQRMSTGKYRWCLYA